MNETKKFIKSSAIYFAGNVLTKIISFFLLPLYTTYINSGDMGYFDLSTSYLNIIIPVVCMEIWSGILRYMFDYFNLSDKYKVIFNGLVIFSFSLFLYTLSFMAINAFCNIQYALLIFLYGLFTMIQTIYTYIARGLGFNTIFALSGIIGSFANSVSNILMILVFHMTISSLYIAMIFGLFIQAVIMEYKVHLLKNLSVHQFDKILIKELIRFSLPLCLNSACFWFLTGYNRVAISNRLGLEANGIYSVAGKFTAVLSLVSTCFSLAWQELVFSKGNDENKSEFYTTAFNYYYKFLMIAIVLFLPVIQIIFPYFIGKQYQSAFSFIPLYLLATAASILSSFLGNIFGAEKQTGIVFLSTIIAAVVNVALFYLLVDSFSIQAANVSLLIGFIVNIVMRLVLLSKTYTIKLDYKIIFICFILFLLSYYFYIRQVTMYNVIFMFFVIIISCIIFRDILKSIYVQIKNKYFQC